MTKRQQNAWKWPKKHNSTKFSPWKKQNSKKIIPWEKHDSTKFRPQKTTHTPSSLCWDVILSNPHAASILYSWRWIWVLRQVNHAFAAALQPERWMQWQCANDIRPMIWKQKANDVLALTSEDLAHLECTVHRQSRYRETHLMWRKDVLGLTLAKYGGTFEGINAIFLKRLARKRGARVG
jgi:hypothetical protein